MTPTRAFIVGMVACFALSACSSQPQKRETLNIEVKSQSPVLLLRSNDGQQTVDAESEMPPKARLEKGTRVVWLRKGEPIRYYPDQTDLLIRHNEEIKSTK